MSPRLPPLNPLHVFVCAAQHCSFTKAAEELRVSQSAVSRQVAVLEHYLGVRLFLRERPGLRLTPDGIQYLAEVGPAFQTIIEATARLAEGASREPLRLQVYPTFMAKWLMRRLPEFQARHPDILVRATASVTQVDFTRHRIDAAIQLGDGGWPGAEVTFLFKDAFAPVCSPALLARGPAVAQPLDLLRYPLLHSHYRRRDWNDWFESLGLKPPDEEEPTVFASSLLTYQAAVDGLGIAMGQTKMLQKELESGALVCPYNHVFERDLGYYFVSPEGMGNRRRLRAFRSWLVDAALRDA